MTHLVGFCGSYKLTAKFPFYAVGTGELLKIFSLYAWS